MAYHFFRSHDRDGLSANSHLLHSLPTGRAVSEDGAFLEVGFMASSFIEISDFFQDFDELLEVLGSKVAVVQEGPEVHRGVFASDITEEGGDIDWRR